MLKERRNIKYYWIVGGCLFVQLLCWLLVQHTEWVERYYSTWFYPVYSYIPKTLFGWLPFSMGDLFYGGVILFLLYLLVSFFQQLFRKQWVVLFHTSLKFIASMLLLYNLFYISWGLNYFKQSLAQHFQLDIESVDKEDYYVLLDGFIEKANTLRLLIDWDSMTRIEEVTSEIEKLMRTDTTFDRMLSKSQVRSKAPVSSTLASYFTVTGYFNPFTHEVQVNQLVPLASYPFTTVHELAHQMGVGFEDECNFIAFQLLANHSNPWYAYSAYYEAIQYFLRPIRTWDQEKFEAYYDRLHPLVKMDLARERAFWTRYTGWIDRVSGAFYNRFLLYNNQPEGTIRYSMMNRLVIAWKKKYQEIEE